MNTQVNSAIKKSMILSKIFIGWNIVFFGLSLLLISTMSHEAMFSVLIRGGIYAIGGVILVYLLQQMKRGKRSGWLRLSVISVLAPIGVVTFIVFTPGLPLWFDAEHLASGIMLVLIAMTVLRKDVRKRFNKSNTVAS